MNAAVTLEQTQRLYQILFEFVERVSKDPDAKPAEIAVLPAIAKILYTMATTL